jgi:hypothetical protein
VLPLTNSVLVERTFFGIHKVIEDGDTLLLVHGTTVHGTQVLTSDESRREAVSYYHDEEPFGDIVRLLPDTGVVGVLGLGAGGIAAHGRDGQTLVFHEIDPAVVDIAHRSFTYLADTEAAVEIVLGDGRLTLDGVHDRYDLLVMDAFTSDAVPVHLLTREAFVTYLETLRPGGLIAVNISNRHLDLGPVVAGVAAELGLDAVQAFGPGTADGATPSRWAMLAPDAESLAELRAGDWDELPERRVLWTDQRSALWQVVRR